MLGMRRIRLAMMIFLLMCGLLGMAGPVPAFDTLRMLPQGEQRAAPDFSLPDYRNNAFTLADLHGKIVVLRFWATW